MGSEPPATGTKQSACKTASYGPSDPLGTVELSAKGDVITVTHRDANYNCAAKVEMAVALLMTGNAFTIQEVITNPGEGAYSTCGVRHLHRAQGQGWHLHGEGHQCLRHPRRREANHRGLQPPAIGTKQSACKAASYGPIDPLGSIELYNVGEVLFVNHRDAHYNCAAKVQMAVALLMTGNVFTIQEVIANPGEGAYCTCYFDISTEIKGVKFGDTYTVKVVNADGVLVGEKQIVISEPPKP